MQFREVVLSDIHAPYHDPWAIELALKCIEILQPTTLVINGDLHDFYSLSKFDRDPSRVQENLQYDLDSGFSILSDFVNACNKNCDIRFVKGNHEERLYRYLCRHPELASLRVLRLESLLRLDELGVIYHEFEYEPLPGALVTHGSRVSKWSAYTARLESEKERYSVSTWTAHTHRLGSFHTKTRNGVISAYESGCLCQLEPETKWIFKPDWQNGLDVIHHDGKEHYTDQALFRGEGKDKRTVIMGETVRL